MEDFKSFEEIEEFVKEVCKKSENLKNTITEFNEKLKEMQRENNECSVEVEEWPQINDEYYAINDFGIINRWNYREEVADFYAFEIGNAFKTWEEAEFELERRKVITELKKYSNTYNPKVNNFCICYSYDEDDFGIYLEPLDEPDIGAHYFESEKMAEKAMKEVGEERIKKYLFGVEE